MIPVHRCIPTAVAALLSAQPLSRGKLEFAWRLAVGDALYRAAGIELKTPGILEVSVVDLHWRREIKRLTPLILKRLDEILGKGVVDRLVIR